jgi:hypothetical protein
MPLDEPKDGQITAAIPQIKPIPPESRRFCKSSISKAGVTAALARSQRERQRALGRVARINRIDDAICYRAIRARCAA